MQTTTTYQTHFLRKPLAVALASGCLTVATWLPASASTSLSTEAIFNFDFTNPLQTPPPPYTLMEFIFGLGGATGQITFNYYDDPDGGGGVQSITNPSQGPGTIGQIPFAPGTLDGHFSVGLQSNSLLLNSIFARGHLCNPDCQDPIIEGPEAVTAPVAGTLRSSVPEPASLALMGIAIAGLAATRRKRRH